jgi:hypothetical protein
MRRAAGAAAARLQQIKADSAIVNLTLSPLHDWYAGDHRTRGELMKRSSLVKLLAVALAVGLGASAAHLSASAEEPYQRDIDALRESLLKYRDVYTAVRDGYFSTVGCVHYDGMKMDGHVEYQKGAMGIHFVNTSLVGPKPDPMRPAILMYEPRDGKLELIGVEWIVPMNSVKERPKLFGQDFLGPMEGHEPIIPKEFAHYDLHAWLFKENPLGLFAATNPEVKCDGYGFSLAEHPTKLLIPAAAQ